MARRERLVIGYGSDLRGDDAAGRAAAAAVAAWALPAVRVLSVHQLTPDLAGPVAEAAAVLFLDAHPAAAWPAPRLRRLAPAFAGAPLAHHADPRTVLAWAALTAGRTPAAYWATIPAHTFALGAPLSARTAEAIQEILPALRRLLETPAPRAAAAPPRQRP